MSTKEAATEDIDAWISPRDILTPVATLVGFIVASIGLAATSPAVAKVFQELSLGLLSVIVLFVGAAFVTCLASLRNSRGVFRAAQFLYMIGWIFTGLFLSLLLLSLAWGIQLLSIKIPALPPNVDLQTVLSVASSVIGAAVALETFRRFRIDRRKVEEKISQISVDRSKVNAITKSALSLDDPKIAFLGVMIEVERTLRDLAIAVGYSQNKFSVHDMRRYLESKGVLDSATSESLAFVWRIRNMIAHSSGDVSYGDAKEALDLAATILAKLQEKLQG